MQVFAAKQTCFTTGDKLGKMKGDTLAIRQNLHRQLELATGFSVAINSILQLLLDRLHLPRHA